MATAYIETTIPSYYVARSSPSLFHAAKQAATREWWDSGCSGLRLFTSLETIVEASKGDEQMVFSFLSCAAPKNSSKSMKINDYPQTVVDPVMAEVRRHKEEIAAAFNYDVVALGRSLQKREVGDPRFVKSTEVQAAKDQTK